MANRTNVLNLLGAQGAEYEEGADSDGNYVFEAWLPDGKMWDSGYGVGIVVQTKEPKETMGHFWDNVLAVINAPVVDQPK